MGGGAREDGWIQGKDAKLEARATARETRKSQTLLRAMGDVGSESDAARLGRATGDERGMSAEARRAMGDVGALAKELRGRMMDPLL